MEKPLAGRTALVTGAGVRLGRALALGLGRAGASVAIHYHRTEVGALEVKETLQAEGGVAEVFSADLRDLSAPAGLAAAVEARLGPISILVNSAARFDRAKFTETPSQVLEALWALNARAPFLLTQAVAGGMVARGAGDVLNVLDIGGAVVPWQQYSAYCMSKAALGMLTQCLALELAPAVRVNGIAPGTVLPPEGLPPGELEALRRRIPLQRFGSPEDVVQTALFLLTGPTFITGQIIAVDGGRGRGMSRQETLGPGQTAGR